MPSHVIAYWPIFLAVLPVIAALLLLALSPFLTVRGVKLKRKMVVKFSLACILIGVSYFAAAVIINSMITRAQSERFSQHKEAIAFDVYQSPILPKDVEMNMQIITTLSKPGNPASTNYDNDSPYLVQRFQTILSSETVSKFYTVSQFDARKYALKDEDCGPVSPEYPDKKERGECQNVGQNPQGNPIYVRATPQRTSPSYKGPVRYSYGAAFTTYGNTRIALDDNFNDFKLDEKIAYMQSFQKTSISQLRFFNENSTGSPTFWLPFF